MFEPETQQPVLFNDIDNTACISRNALAALCGVPAAVLSRATTGQRDLSFLEYTKVRATVDDLIEIQNRFAPAKLDWSDVRHTRMLIEDLHRTRKQPLQPLSSAESARLAKFAAGADLDDLLIDAQMTKQEFLQHIESLLVRATRIAELARQQHREKQ